MVIKKLPRDTSAGRQWTHLVEIEASVDFTSSDTGTTKTIQIFPSDTSATFDAGFLVKDAAMILTTSFDSTADSSINSLLVEIGDGSDPNRILGQFELAEDGTEIDYGVRASTAPYVYLSADTLDVKFTVAGGASPTIAEVDSGKVRFLLNIEDLNDYARI